MLYYFLFPLREIFFPFNVLRYITFRAAAAFITAMIINFFIAPAIIRTLQRKNKLQVIKSDTPSTHLKKEGTPTMGGIIIIISLISSVLLWGRFSNVYIILLGVSTLWLGILGFVDDYVSSKNNNSDGLSPKIKIFWQVMLGLGLAFYFYFNPSSSLYPQSISVPFFKDIFINLGSAYIIFVHDK